MGFTAGNFVVSSCIGICLVSLPALSHREQNAFFITWGQNVYSCSYVDYISLLNLWPLYNL